tara:strand:- start:139 stop:1245 length:1107 start_codon:yes stop_codon:yes gene_type:complete
MAITRLNNNSIKDTTHGVNFRNIIINGDMSVSQRGTSFSASTSEIYTLDRFKYIKVDSPDNVYTITQDTDVPSGQGFAKSLKVDVATADASLDSSDGTQIETKIEGQNLQYLNFGNSSAKSLTLSFWVKSNKTGTYVVRLLEPDASSRMTSFAYTISSASTWEKKTISVPADTGGTINNDNGAGLNITWWLSAGTDYQSGSLASTWQAYSNGDSAVGQVNLADSTSNEWYITGVQLEAGTSASDFEFLPFDVQLDRCLRYFQKSYAYGTALGSATENGAYTSHFFIGSSNQNYYTVFLQIPMRSSPSVVFYSTATGATGKYRNLADGEDRDATLSTSNDKLIRFRPSGNGGVGNDERFGFQYTTDAEL